MIALCARTNDRPSHLTASTLPVRYSPFKECRAMPTTNDLATLLLDAHARAALVEPPSASDPAFDLLAAYVVGQLITTRRRERGERTVGRKIGFTNVGIWKEYGVNAPLWAHVYDTTLRRAPEGRATLSLAGMAAPRIEPELVLGLRSAPPAEAPTPQSLLRSVAWIAVGFEVVDCHFADWRFSLADAVADFGLHAALVVGAPLVLEPDRDEGLLGALARCTLTLERNGEMVATGAGANALGSPLLALGHLVRTLAEQGVEPLAAGEVVTTGTLTPAFPVASCQTWSASVAGLDLASLTLTLR
jgi:2-keto-4-pentenoate hydratase